MTSHLPIDILCTLCLYRKYFETLLTSMAIFALMQCVVVLYELFPMCNDGYQMQNRPLHHHESKNPEGPSYPMLDGQKKEKEKKIKKQCRDCS